MGWQAECFDHVAIGVADLAISREWYINVLQMEDAMQHEPTFVGPDLRFLRQGSACLALLALNTDPLRGSRAQKGHFALRVDGVTFWDLHASLPQLLQTHRVSSAQSIGILCDDFAVQLSMFFFDPDGNEVEIATWDCERDDTCMRFGGVDGRSIRGAVQPQPGGAGHAKL
jgi:catechol 2,3-dioxygenase-like lactoylglutathione lyase family enzyme